MDLQNLSGLAGTVLAMIAYLPQIIHLIKEKCSAGISLTTYSLWIISSVLLLINAVGIKSFVFTVFQIFNIIAIFIIIFFGKLYEGQRCPYHKSHN